MSAAAWGRLVLRYEWSSPPIAQAWSYEITLWPDVGELAVMPGHPGPDVPRWAETFFVDPDLAPRLRAQLAASGLLAGGWERGAQPVGGDSHRLVVWLDGAGTTWPADLAAAWQAQVRRLGDVARAAVPAALWSAMEARRVAYR